MPAPIQLYNISGNPPAATSGPCVNKGGQLTPDELQQNFINMADGINKFVGEAANQAEENALFAAGYRFVIRTDISAPVSTVIFTNFSGDSNPAPASTIVFSNFS
jgi:hypothetical protein